MSSWYILDSTKATAMIGFSLIILSSMYHY